MSKAQPKVGGGVWPLVCAITLLIWLLARLLALALHGGLAADPDAAYGMVIARNLAERGLVTFDGQTLTSGFSPLWTGLLALQHRLMGPQLAVTFVMEAILLAAALWVLLRASPVRSRLFQAAFTAGFAWIAAGFGLLGLETSLLALALGLFIAALTWRTESLLGGLALGASALLCLATRMETAVFLLPALLLAPTRVANRVLGLMLLGFGLLGYGAVDLIKFNAALPITSQMRSLGGAQINTALIVQGIESFARYGFQARLLIVAAALAATPLLVPLAPPESQARAVSLAAALAAWLILARLMLFSSWRVGPLQEVAALLPLIAAYFVIAPLLAALFDRLFTWIGRPRLMQPAPAGLAALVLAGLIGQSALAANDYLPPPMRADETAHLVEALVRQHGVRMNGARIAMGDGAGMLALAYDGPVTGLEGQASDLAYLQTIQAGGDITPTLCARGVRYLAAVRPDLGRYGRESITVLDPGKTVFHGPTVEVDSRDQVARIVQSRPGSRVLYLWRLGACWRNGYAALPERRHLR